jgi:hypothetical protein
MDQLFTFSADALFIARVSVTVFFGILFIQSGFDKVFNFRENLSYLYEHFSKTFIGGAVPVVFSIITILEVAAGLISAYGAVDLIIHKRTEIALLGIELSVLSLLSLFFGLRVAKDYPGATSLVAYFSASIISLFVLA